MDIIIVIISVVLVGFFAGVETALVSCNKIRIRYKKDKGSLRAKIIWDILQNPHRMLGTTLVGTNLFVVTGTIFATYFFVRMFGENGPGIATIVMTPVILIVSEIIPKSLSRIYADQVALMSGRMLLLFEKLLFPIVILVEAITNVLIRIFGIKTTKKNLFITKEDIELLVRQITREGVLERSEQGAIHQILDFHYTRVGEIMIRLGNIIAIDYKDTREDVLEKAKKYKFTRYPVLEDKKIKGVLNIYDIFYSQPNSSKEGSGKGDWHKLIRPLREVYSNQRINQVLYKMQRNKDLMCAVVRNSKFIGIITLEDIISEIELI